MYLKKEVRQQLIEAAISVRVNAYVPYSHYPVGAAVLTRTGKIFSGVNIENAAYPSGICAERVALFKAISEGEKQFEACAVVTDNAGSPCGACRQVMAEFGLDMLVIITDPLGTHVKEMTVADLLPRAFRPEHLKPAK